VRFVGRGHPAIRATHTKTLEISRDEEITERATCVVAVGARPEPAHPMAGPVRITLRVGEQSALITARGSPAWDPAGPAVIRHSPLRLPGTFATHADVAAADLPRELVAALQSPDAEIEVRVELLPTDRRTVVLFAADPSRPDDPRLRAELDAADAVIAEDDGARALLPPGAASRPTPNPGRTLVVATADLPGARMWTDLKGADIDVIGLPAPLAAAAASPTPGPVLLGTDGDPAELIRTAPSTARLVVRAGPEQLPALLALARQTRGTSGATIAQDYTPPQRVTAGEPVELPSRDPVHICFDAAEPSDSIEPAVRAAIDGLLAAGVTTKTAANALAALTGWDRRRAYDAVLSWRSA
jgi:hypothetical protein